MQHRPRIWAANLEELKQAVPELSRMQNDVAFEATQTPVIILDGEMMPGDSWDGGRIIDLLMVRRFSRSANDCLLAVGISPNSSSGNYLTVAEQAQLMSGQRKDLPRALEPLCTPEPQTDVVQQDDGLYHFIEPAFTPDLEDRDVHSVALQSMSPPLDGSTMNRFPSAGVASLAPADGPPEINALMEAHEADVPVCVILCRNAAIAPFLLREECGCAFLGFFTIQDVQVRTEDKEWDVRIDEDSRTIIHGTKTWHFRFEWTPGGEQLDPAAIDRNPWWMPPVQMSSESIPNPEPSSLLLPYTLLPLYFLAPPTQNVCTDADVRVAPGWHCVRCGRLNVQRNLCAQACATCSTPNGLEPISVEYVRQVRGTDPMSFPLDRYEDTVGCSSSDGPDGLPRFTYVLSGAGMVYHMFTRNRAEAQVEPTKLFRELQADVQIVLEPAAVKGKALGGVGPHYFAQFSNTSGETNTPQDDTWPAIAPLSVCRARELMLYRGQLLRTVTAMQLVIDCLTICAWRTAGNKKGCIFSAEASPIVMMCLGADVEIAFWRQKTSAGAPFPETRAQLPTSGALYRTAAGTVESVVGIPVDALDEDDETTDYLSVFEDGSLPPPPPPQPVAPRPPQVLKEEVLMVTLVHGDVLVVHGSTFEYSMKRTGMSIVLVGA
ncbi:hypothetical protein BN946_scf184783.g1 [Trametes cinnabarina]|uniref:Uncharacterized protein n=1 Tax=Pycnoporus cinnabarinus TaxID=5643 RepID=A0A060S6K3_PYCCI|nr:hypothetical protein BN946_scf184783.g1 [Trametes cinnabarina]